MGVLLTSCADVTLIEDVAYDDRYGGETLLDVYMPNDDSANRPGYVLIHGGGWRWGAKESVADRAYRIAHAGFVVFAINYRLTPRGAYPRLIQDCYCALGFIQEHAADYGVDPTRLVAGGWKIGLLNSSLGLMILAVAALAWFGLQLRWRFLLARSVSHT